MIPPSRIVLLTLCAILTGTDLTSGFVIRKPDGECRPILPGVRCLSRVNQCESNKDCHWNEKCCSNGCGKVCMRVYADLPPVTKGPIHEPFWPPAKPYIPFQYNPYYRPPPPDPIPYRPDLPPRWFPPMDPPRHEPDGDYFPSFPGGGADDFP